MGHASVNNLSKMFLRRLFAKGVVTLKELVDIAEKKGECLHASECDYKDRHMLSFGFDEVLLYYFRFYKIHDPKTRHEVPVVSLNPAQRLTDIQQKTYDTFVEEGLVFDSDEEYEAFDSIEWVFTKMGRKNYLKLKILQDIEN